MAKFLDNFKDFADFSLNCRFLGEAEGSLKEVSGANVNQSYYGKIRYTLLFNIPV
jgi:hypothetical protein